MPQVAVVGELSALLQQAGSVQNAYSSMCCKALSRAGTEQYAAMPIVTPRTYWQGLKAGSAIQHMGVSTAAQGNRDKAMQELAEWLQKSVPSKGLGSCILKDIIVYLVTWWAEEHGGCTAPDGSKFAAPVSLEAICSHMAVSLDKLGRTGEWDQSCLTGNVLAGKYR